MAIRSTTGDPWPFAILGGAEGRPGFGGFPVELAGASSSEKLNAGKLLCRHKVSRRFYPAPADWDLPRLGSRVRNPFARSSRPEAKLSPPYPGQLKSPTPAACVTGLGVRHRNELPNLTPNSKSSKAWLGPFLSQAFSRAISMTWCRSGGGRSASLFARAITGCKTCRGGQRALGSRAGMMPVVG